MEVISFSLTHTRPDVFDIYPIGDIHLGSIACVEDELQKTLQAVLHNPKAYMIGMGDMTECITKNDPRFDVGGLADWVVKDNIVESQRQRVVELLKPLADKGKIITLLTGNHEETVHSVWQYDMTRNLCQDLKVSYGGYSCFVVMNFLRGKRTSVQHDTHEYIIHCHHGAGGAQTEGSRTMRLMRLVNDIEAHIYLMGHLHCITTYTPDRLSHFRGRIKSTNLIATTTGSWLKAYAQPHKGRQLNASYAEQKGYKPNRLGCPVIHINPDKNWFKVEV